MINKIFLLKYFIKKYNNDNSISIQQNNYEKIFNDSLKYEKFNEKSENLY